jgi:predicted metal-dependent phosphoesterase TrpH
MVAKLEGLGISIEWERVLQLAKGGAVGRPHIAQAMYENGYVGSFQEAFDRYLGRNGPVYVERYRLTPLEAVELVVQVKGLPVLAHPAELADLEDLLTQFQKAGLVGLEAYYNGYPIQTVRELVALANKHGLIASGGSDFHGNENDAPLGSVYVPLNAAQQLIALAKRRQEVAAE